MKDACLWPSVELSSVNSSFGEANRDRLSR